MIKDEIILLEREKWQDHRLEFHYISYHYYDVERQLKDGSFSVTFTKKDFAEPYEKNPDDSDRLFQPWWDDIMAWGIVRDDRLIAAIETAAENWSNRLRVTELWVDDAYRRLGIATALMDIAITRARAEKRRVLMLETQSCNAGAIAFYTKYGFSPIGFDLCAYANNDVERREVRIELGILLE